MTTHTMNQQRGRARTVTLDPVRLGAWALIVGAVVATVGYLAASFVHGDGDARFTQSLWTPLNAIAIVGDLIMVLGLPVVLVAQRGRSRKLTLFGYVGLYAALTMLNICEGVIEAFVKPYLARHGGVPADTPAGFAVFEGIALFFLVFGVIALGVAVLRARVVARWIGVAFVLSPILGFVLPEPVHLLGDYCAYAALVGIAAHLLRDRTPAAILDAPDGLSRNLVDWSTRLSRHAGCWSSTERQSAIITWRGGPTGSRPSARSCTAIASRAASWAGHRVWDRVSATLASSWAGSDRACTPSRVAATCSACPSSTIGRTISIGPSLSALTSPWKIANGQASMPSSGRYADAAARIRPNRSPSTAPASSAWT